MRSLALVIFDLDGIFYRGEIPIQGGKEMIEFLEHQAIRYCFLTNNSSYPPEVYKEKLQLCGIQTTEKHIITASILMKNYLKEQKINSIFVLGSNHLKRSLYETFTMTQDNPDALVVGMDDEITLMDISNALSICTSKTHIVATNADYFIPRDGRFDLECGAILDIIKKATNKPISIVGKPNSFAFLQVIQMFEAQKEHVLMVGDTYETDIKGALKAGLHAAWVATGNPLPQAYSQKEFHQYASLYELKETLKQLCH